MIITKEILKSEIDKVPEGYFEILYRVIQRLTNGIESTATPDSQLSENILTLQQVVATIESMPKNPVNVEPATESLAKKLRYSPYERDASFDVEDWNRQWDDIEAQMKRDELIHQEIERHI